MYKLSRRMAALALALLIASGTRVPAAAAEIRNGFPEDAAAGTAIASTGAEDGQRNGASGQTEDPGKEAAEILYERGVMTGSGTLPDGSPDFAPGRTLTRGEAAALLIRAMGWEEEALSHGWPHPFPDAGWAEPYAGMAYARGIMSGISKSEFGPSEEISPEAFLTMALRALSIGTGGGQDPYPEAEAAGLFEGEPPERLTRGVAAEIALRAMDLAGTEKAVPEIYAASFEDFADTMHGCCSFPFAGALVRISCASAAEYMVPVRLASKPRPMR